MEITIGFIFGFCLSFLMSLIFMMLALGFVGGAIGSDFLYTTTIIFLILTSLLFGYYFAKKEDTSDKKIKQLSLLSALFLCVSIIFMLIEHGVINIVQLLFGEGWLYFATIVPFALTFSVLGFYFTKQEDVSNKRLWLLSLTSALFISLYSGTIGALFGEFIMMGGSLKTYVDGGYIGVNVEEVLIWGTIYSIILIPITVLVTRLIIEVFLRLLKKYKMAS